MTDARDLAPFQNFLPDQGFKWRTGAGEWVSPSKMDTRHLFHVVKMIWNNSVPRPAMYVGGVKLYNFDRKYYTWAYMRLAVLHCGRELMRRADRTESMDDALWEMAWWINSGEYTEVDQKRLSPAARARKRSSSWQSFGEMDRRMRTVMERGPPFLTGRDIDDPYYDPDPDFE